MFETRIVYPKVAARGDVIEVKTLIQHPMETGYRRTDMGAPIPRDIIVNFSAEYLGTEVFAARLFTGVAANPFFVFTLKARETGDIKLTWVDEKGSGHVETVRLVVT